MHPQLEKFKDQYLALQPRERWVIAGGAALVLLTVLYVFAIAPLNRAASERGARIAQKQSDLAWMRSRAGEVAAFGRVAGRSGANESLIVLIANSANQNGLGNALTGQTPTGSNSVRVRLENANFDSVVQWIGLLQQQYGVTVDSASIDRAAKTGEINANLNFVRGNGAA